MSDIGNQYSSWGTIFIHLHETPQTIDGVKNTVYMALHYPQYDQLFYYVDQWVINTVKDA